ncbi:uncharacterized protein A4U43_C07F34700 [Asparagus officinalis]|uniref:Protein kinase domain-containing protein n=1 Tax=Asparagus officinalis TaxID=4686 RepID=A0A5P1EK71_ASPOF|nr:uncharacterized protein A4U43_C07F34700 [Asparagus officinalis]
MNIFEIVCFIFFFLIPAQSQLPSSDILALLAFKKGITNDPTGYITDSWNEESIDFNGCPSSWNGILCNGGKVAAIVLDNHGISGTADLSVFSNLTLLFKISMKNNNFTGMLPDDIDGFQSLKFLDVSNNLLFGKVPDSFGNLKSLQNLSLSGNNFSGSIPNSIGGLGSIQSLDLSKNSLSGSLPSALKSLKRLVYLDLSFNTFSKGIPAVFADIPSLEFLDLSWNQLDGGVPWSLLMESKIVHVDLSGNLLRSSNAEEMKFLAEVSETVKYLNLSNNQLTGSLIDGGEMSTFGSLKVLDLSYNQLSGPLPGFDYVYDLEVLRLGNNGFDGFLPNGLLKGDSLVLSELDLSANNLSGNIGWITSTTLQTLNLSSNTLSGDLPLLIGSCRILDLSKNQLSGNISVTSKWGNDLEFIDLSQNQLTGPIPEVTSQFLRLNYLNLSHNSLSSTLPKVLLQYPKLTILDLSSNKFDGHILTDLLTSSTLQELNLGNNQLFGEIVFSPSLSYKSDLQALNLSSNRFNGTFPDNLTSLSRLQVLDISTNNFSGLLPPSITNLTYLNSLDISLNQFTGPLPSNLPDTLMAFNASYNDLSGPIPANLQKFPDTSFHPGNSRLESPAGHPNNGTSPSERRGHKHKRLLDACAVLFMLESISRRKEPIYRPGRRGPPLTWAQRLKIAVDVARGLNYLHFDRAVPHGNLKSTNILLDGLDLNARVSDYCLHRLMTQSGTTEQILDSGVLGYRAPELTSSKKPSPSFKSDAYAFGVVMLELLTGKCAGDVISGDEGGVDLCDWVRLRVAEGRGSDCFDGELGGEIAGNLAAGKGMKEMLGIALRCIRPVSERPGIRSVYEDLSSI